MATAHAADAAARDTEELDAFRVQLRRFVAREIEPQVAAWEAAGALPRALFEQLGALGYLGLRAPESEGGGGLGFAYTAVLIEELLRCGAVGVPVSILAHAEFATHMIARVGTPEQRATFLRPAIAGWRIGALAITEPDAGSDVAALATRAEREGQEYVLHGAKTFITNGGIADFAVVAARTGGPGARGLSLILVPADTPGYRRSPPLRKLGAHSSNTAELSFDACRVPAANILGTEGEGFRLIMEGFEAERLVLAVICCSQMRLMWERARAYGQERRVFGRPVLAFQAWQHRLADARADIEAAWALTRSAIAAYDRGEEANALISMAKLFASERALKVAHDCAQIFGGNGYMEEYPIGRMFRDSLAFTVGAGTSEVMREIIAREEGLVPGREGR